MCCFDAVLDFFNSFYHVTGTPHSPYMPEKREFTALCLIQSAQTQEQVYSKKQISVYSKSDQKALRSNSYHR
jgi:hypothetical protein